MRYIAASLVAALLLTFAGCGRAPNFTAEEIIVEGKDTPYAKWFVWKVKVDEKGVGDVRKVVVEITSPSGEKQVVTLTHSGEGLFISEPTKVGPFFSASVDEIRKYEVSVTLVDNKGRKRRKLLNPVELRGICTQPPAPPEFK